MAAITAQAVNDLRKRTGLGLMECKALLKETDGDSKAAETLAKERNLTKAAGRAGRAATAGRVEVALAPDGKAGALVEIGCETDFVARNEDFRAATRELAEHLLAAKDDAPLADQASRKDGTKTVKDELVALNVRTGENVTLARQARFAVPAAGRVDAYVHHDAKSGALVQVDAPDDATASTDAFRQLVKDLGLQVVAAKPLTVRREEVDPEVVAEQRRIFVAQAADKPEGVRDKIANGKLDAWFGETTLLEQVFVKDASKKVRDVVAAAGKGITVAKFARFVIGESSGQE